MPYVLAVTVGSTVDFPNSDRIYHNVFSLSKPRRFDLGRYPRGQSRSVRFDRPGVVRVFCEIHSHMSAFILVFAHRFFAVTDAEGRYRIDDVPPGTYTLARLERRAGARAPGGARRAAPGDGRAGLHGGVMARPAGARCARRVFAATALLAVLPHRAGRSASSPRRVTQEAEAELARGLDEAARARRAAPRGSRSRRATERASLVADLPQAQGGGRRPATRRTVEPVARDYRGARALGPARA